MAFVERSTRLQHHATLKPALVFPTQTNSYRMHFPQGEIHHFDVDIQPLWETSSEFKYGMKKGNEIVGRVQAIDRDLFRKKAAFDGKKSLYGPEYYFAEKTYTVSWDHNPDERRVKKEVRVVIKHVNTVDFNLLQGYLQSQKIPRIEVENQINLILNMLNILVQASPRTKPGVLTTHKSVFAKNQNPQGLNPGDVQKIAPLELWRGYFQSVRPAFDRLIINVDVTVGVVLPEGLLENVCCEFLRIRNRNDLKRLSPDKLGRLKQFLKGVKARVLVGKNKDKSAKMIIDIIPDVGEKRFERNGEMITLAQYWREAYNVSIPSGSLGVRLKDFKGDFPVSQCMVSEQLYKNRASPEVVQAALKFTPVNPSMRMREIKRAFEYFDYRNSEFLYNAKIRVDPELQSIPGRRLQSPAIHFNGSHADLSNRSGVWDVMRRVLSQPASIKTWAIVDYAQISPDKLNYFIDELIRAMKTLGMMVGAPVTVEHRSAQADTVRHLMELRSRFNPDLILAFLPDPAEMQYRQVKRFGDISHGVATQCVKWSRNLMSNVDRRRINQYQNNLILKINPKMGGVNFKAKSNILDALKKNPFMIIGSDVSHPGPGSQQPSIASVVASYDTSACQYAATVRVQPPRIEMIQDFGGMFTELLQNFKDKNGGVLPKIIAIFRDGVSEGEFITVLNHERGAMKGVLPKFYGEDMRAWPQTIYMVVGKRHHVRFFPSDSRPDTVDPAGNANFHPGLVVDKDIVHPRYCDFYLQSQAGLKGTSIPSHYTVLRNDVGMPLAAIQELAYTLCHCYSRSTRSVKVPAPVYYADLVCRRAKFHFDESINDFSGSSSGSGSQSGDSAIHMDYFQSHFSQVHQVMRDRMYFL